MQLEMAGTTVTGVLFCRTKEAAAIAKKMLGVKVSGIAISLSSYNVWPVSEPRALTPKHDP